MFLVKNFPVGQRVLVDSSSGQSATQGDGKKEEVTRQGEIPLVKEVSLVSLGNNRSRPYLLVCFFLTFINQINVLYNLVQRRINIYALLFSRST